MKPLAHITFQIFRSLGTIILSYGSESFYWIYLNWPYSNLWWDILSCFCKCFRKNLSLNSFLQKFKTRTGSFFPIFNIFLQQTSPQIRSQRAQCTSSLALGAFFLISRVNLGCTLVVPIFAQYHAISRKCRYLYHFLIVERSSVDRQLWGLHQ